MPAKKKPEKTVIVSTPKKRPPDIVIPVSSNRDGSRADDDDDDDDIDGSFTDTVLFNQLSELDSNWDTWSDDIDDEEWFESIAPMFKYNFVAVFETNENEVHVVGNNTLPELKETIETVLTNCQLASRSDDFVDMYRLASVYDLIKRRKLYYDINVLVNIHIKPKEIDATQTEGITEI